jgi:protein gp37
LADVFEDFQGQVLVPISADEQIRNQTYTLTDARSALWELIEQTPGLDWQLLTKRPENILAMTPAQWHKNWPSHVWVGCTVEGSAQAYKRLPQLLEVPAAVRFVSYEPALEYVDFRPWYAGLNRINWLVVGGESGPKARVFEVEWALQALQDAHGRVPIFIKQMGSHPFWKGERLPLIHAKGGDPAEWAPELRVQEFPQA